MNFFNFIPEPIRNRIIQFLVSKAGGLLVPWIAGAVAIGVSKLTPFMPEAVSTIDQSSVVTFIWLALMALVNYATNHWLTKYSKVIQTSLVQTGAKLHVDGWIGDETLDAFEAHTGIPVRRAIADAPPSSGSK